MRLVRLVALVIVLATVYFAQYLFDTTSLADFFPAWLLTWWAPFGAMPRWLPDDLLELAIWLTLMGLLSFGLLASWWQGERGHAYRRLPPGRASLRVWWWAAQILLVLALITSLVGSWLAAQGETSSASWIWPWVWGISLLLYIGGGIIANQVRPPVIYGEIYLETVRPWGGWPYLAALLVFFAALYCYRLLDIPIRIDALSARSGLAAQAWVRDSQAPQIAAAPNNLPLPVLALTAVARVFFQDNLMALRTAGVLTALVLLVAIWLLGSELFRRVPVYGHYGEVLEDDGRWIALMAMLIAGVSLPMLHWARSPVLLDGVALGTIALWAILRGVRRDRPLYLGVSALAVGWAVYYGPVGLVMGIVALLMWCGIMLLESSWLGGKQLARGRGGEAVPVQHGVGWRGFGYWIAGIVIVIMPLFAKWMTVPGAFAAHWVWPDGSMVRQGSALIAWRERLEMSILGLNHLSDATGTLHYNEHFVHSLMAPLLALALGALVLNIDSLVGWTLTSWLVTGLVAAGLTVSVVPSWVATTVLIPAIALAIAFSIDRIRLFIMTNGGTWTLQATVYLAVGIVFAAGLLSWITFYNVAQSDSDLATSVGRALREAEDSPIVLVDADAQLRQTLSDPVVVLLASARGDLYQIPSLDAQRWPELVPGTRLLLAPGDSQLQMAMEAAYPNGSLSVLRDLQANPLLFVYDLVDTATNPDP